MRGKAASVAVLAVAVVIAGVLGALALAAFTERIGAGGGDRPGDQPAALLATAHAARPGDPARERARGQARRLAEDGRDRIARSAAANVLAILLFEEVWLDDERNAERHVAASLEAFQDAVRLDPRNTDAKFNLELLLALLPDEGAGEGGPAESDPGLQPGTGAGATPPGRGY